MNAAQHILVAGVRFYRWVISPAKTLVFGPLGQCRYSPSCSEYAIDAVRLHGALTGSWLAFKRIGRCHPWGGCGWDPVPNPRILDAAREETECCGGPNCHGGGLPKGGSLPARGISLNNTATAATGAVTRHS